MAKGDDKRVRDSIASETTNRYNEYNLLQNTFFDQYGDARERDKRTYDTVYDNLAGFKPHYNPDDYLGAAGYLSGGGGIGDGGAGGTGINIRGGIDPSRIDSMGAEAYGGYRKMAEGLQQPFWDDYRSWEARLKSSSDSAQRFIDTGGFSTGELDNMRERAYAPARANFDATLAQLQANQARTGNSSAAGLIRAQRQNNQALSDAAVGVEDVIAKQIQEGRKFGTQQLASNAVAGMDARTQVEALDQQMRAQGLGGMTDIEKARLTAQLENAQLNQNADIATAQIAESAANRGASSSAARAAQSLAEAQFRAGLDVTGNNQFLTAQDLLTGLYGTTPGATAEANKALLTLQSLRQSGLQDLLNARIAGAQLPGKFASAMGNIGSAFNLGGGVSNLLGNIFGGGGGSTAGTGTSENKYRIYPDTLGLG